MNSNKSHTFYKWLRLFLSIELFSITLILAVYLYLEKNGIIFQNLTVLYALLILPLIYVLYFFRLKRKIDVFENNPALLFSLNEHYFKIFNLKFIFLKNTFIAVIIALSNPIYGTRKVDVVSKDGEIMICLDISNSMNVKDIEKESRLEVSKRLLNGIINKLSGQKIGICLFAADGFIQIPPSQDYQSVKNLLSDVKTTFLSRQGTNVCNALELSMNAFTANKIPKSILLITDGENHISEDKSIYNRIRKDNVLLYTMGIGSLEGGPVPDFSTKSLKLDEKGNLVISKLNFEFTQSLTNQCGGKLVRIDSRYPDLSPLLTEINLRSKGYYRNLKIEVRRSLVDYPVWLGFLFFLLFLFTPLLKLLNK
ncbi:VWA domain-containing protein [Crocinitomicaceae bacterium]|nr:VWA domain-containing protein [Crocinitomicaceae bacterium]